MEWWEENNSPVKKQHSFHCIKHPFIQYNALIIAQRSRHKKYLPSENLTEPYGSPVYPLLLVSVDRPQIYFSQLFKLQLPFTCGKTADTVAMVFCFVFTPQYLSQITQNFLKYERRLKSNASTSFTCIYIILVCNKWKHSGSSNFL